MLKIGLGVGLPLGLLLIGAFIFLVWETRKRKRPRARDGPGGGLGERRKGERGEGYAGAADGRDTAVSPFEAWLVLACVGMSVRTSVVATG